MEVLRETIRRAALSDRPVLVTGPTGSGKELVVEAVHTLGPHPDHPLLDVNCGAIPEALMESQLFGHAKGAFTGAVAAHEGYFMQADGGTLFIDEIGELPLETQTALLRVLQEREFERVGGTRPIHADVRVIAATNRDLQKAVDAGTFRSDLFYRLNVFPIEVPPLRERTGDIRLLVEHFARRHAAVLGKTVRRISRTTLDLLESYPWPGNVRELQNIVERSLIVCESDTLSVDESWLSSSRRVATSTDGGATTLDGVKRAHILRVLEETNWTLGGPGGAAVRLGLTRTTLQSLLKRLGLEAPMSAVRAAV
jgi:formate hydrogenlyase transcriptional activator